MTARTVCRRRTFTVAAIFGDATAYVCAVDDGVVLAVTTLDGVGWHVSIVHHPDIRAGQVARSPTRREITQACALVPGDGRTSLRVVW